jgi:hypothetical protein
MRIDWNVNDSEVPSVKLIFGHPSRIDDQHVPARDVAVEHGDGVCRAQQFIRGVLIDHGDAGAVTLEPTSPQHSASMPRTAGRSELLSDGPSIFDGSAVRKVEISAQHTTCLGDSDHDASLLAIPKDLTEVHPFEWKYLFVQDPAHDVTRTTTVGAFESFLVSDECRTAASQAAYLCRLSGTLDSAPGRTNGLP